VRVWAFGLFASSLGGCVPAGGPLPRLAVLPENFAPYGVAFARYTAPEFPAALRATGVSTGYAVVAVTIDDDGRVEDAVGIEASDPAFVEAVVAVTPQWLLVPGEGDTQPRREVLHYRFRSSGAIRLLSHREGAAALFVESADDFARVRTVSAEEVDGGLVRLEPPADAPFERPAGNASVSFVVDEDGRVRVPVVVAASDAAFGAVALAALKNWRFAPPLRNGEPVLAEVRARWGG
jgi:TonB family protein